ncbi:Tfp pilus assembly protein FimT/FimU [Patescibacteria group bacterium]
MIYDKKQSGVTLVELSISIAIFALLTAIVLLGFMDSRKHNEFKSAAENFVSNLRQLQAYAIGGREVSGMVPGSFGIFMNINTEFDRYQLYGDTTSFDSVNLQCLVGGDVNRRFDQYLFDTKSYPNCNQEPTVDTGTVMLPPSVVLDNVRIGVQSPTIIDITFSTPESLVGAQWGANDSDYDPTTVDYDNTADYFAANSTIKVCLRHTQLNRYRMITLLGATGQVNLSSTIDTCPI